VTARVLVVGLDAAEATLLTQWADDGMLTTLAALRSEGAELPLTSPMETLPGAIWPELQTGRSVGRVGQYYHPWQLHTGEANVRPLAPGELDGELYYWTAAARAGRRACVVDQPQSVVVHDGDGAVQLAEWGTHDRNFGADSQPAALLDEVRAAHGDHPVVRCDSYGSSVEERRRLFADVERGLAARSDLLCGLLARDEWDLFVATFTESHCGGHHLWEYFACGAPADLAGGIPALYRGIDTALGRLIAAAGPDCVTLVVASHGMGPNVGGPQLVREVLLRLGLVSGSRARRMVPPALRAWLRRRAPAVTDTLSRATGLNSPRTRAVALDNNRCAALRLNLEGREPHGSVRPADAPALLGRIADELRALRLPGTQEPIVADVRTADELFGPDHHPDLPDLVVSFRTDLGLIEACESPSVGRVHAPFNPGSTRTGDHTPVSRLWVTGHAGARLPEQASVLDLAPTVLSLLDVDLPPDLDGRPLLGARSGAERAG